jgi:hypothetical protein
VVGQKENKFFNCMERKFSTEHLETEDDLLEEGKQTMPYLEKGPSKIEKGLRNFRIYRMASGGNILDLHPKNLKSGEVNVVSKRLLNRAIFFTTQKEMALDYSLNRTSYKHPPVLLFEAKGIEFLEDLQKLEDQGITLLLFSHSDLAVYERILMGEVKSDEEIENFFKKHTYKPSDISLRGLRKMAEIIVLLPEELNKLPIRGKKKGAKSLPDYNDSPQRSPGTFHNSVYISTLKGRNKESNFLKNKIRRLNDERNKLMYDIAFSGSYEEKRKQSKRLEEVERELEKIKRERNKYD